jgi:hypothetical protein
LPVGAIAARPSCCRKVSFSTGDDADRRPGPLAIVLRLKNKESLLMLLAAGGGCLSSRW